LSDLDPDAKLVERISHGDPAAIRMFVATKLPRILGLAGRMLQDSGEAEDVAQEAFVRVWKQARAWQPGRARFDTWLHTVVLNLCRDRLRRRREITTDTLPETIDPAPDAEAKLLDKEHGDAIAAAIAALPERQREAILLVHYQDLSGTQAALALDVSVDALESLLARGRRTLRAQFTAARGDEA
jgi:RNA polymerase sigma-70 factor (ECF subfamily)